MITVVIPVYHRVDPSHFDRALQSIRHQTLAADEILIVEDGPIGAALDAIATAQCAEDGRLRRVPLKENRGVAYAMQAGLEQARNRWIARMDSDDIALPNRLELQWLIAATGEYAAIGGAMLEFEGDESNIIATRSMPLTDAEIHRYVKVNSPINNPTLLLDRDAAFAVGGVRHVPNMEDYDLFARLSAGGYRMMNLAEPLGKFRADPAVFVRRTKGMAKAEWQMQRNLRSYGLIGTPRMCMNFLVRSVYRALPRPLILKINSILFRSKTRGDSTSSRGTHDAG